MTGALAGVLMGALACHAPPPADARTVLLSLQSQAMTELELPPTSRPEGAATPTRIRLRGDFEPLGERGGVSRWGLPMPIEYVYQGHSTRKVPKGMTLKHKGRFLAWKADKGKGKGKLPPSSFHISHGQVTVRLVEGAPAPLAEDFELVYPRATQAEARLNLAESGLEARDFAVGTVQPGADRHRGVLLPAPASASWELELPPQAQLSFDAHILPPPVRDGAKSDGATLRVELVQGERVWSVAQVALSVGRLTRVQESLPALDGPVTLRLVTEPGDSALLDYVFLREPSVYTPLDEPRRVVMVFVDTLRPDRMSLYGHSRPTTPATDAWASGAAVFDQARTLTPWTLPSTRTALTGLLSEQWQSERSLPVELGEQGFSSVALVGNAFLTPSFDMGEGWSTYRYRLLDPAPSVVNRALEVLEQHQDRELLLMVHFMGVHMPFREPERYQGWWAGEPPPGLAGAFGRESMADFDGDDPELMWPKEYVGARYDQNLRFIDDQLAALYDALQPSDLVIFFSDHGEAMWEHGGVEHGHNLHEEVLKVPLIVRGPGVPAGRSDASVGLVDIVATVRDVVGLPAGEGPGRSLRQVLVDDQVAQQVLQRALPLGHRLYGSETWGLLQGGRKWIARDGELRAYDLAEDPQELSAVSADVLEYAEGMATALGRPVPEVWRLWGSGERIWAEGGVRRITLAHPGGLKAVWAATDPLDTAVPPKLVDGVMVLERPRAGGRLPRELYVLPAGDPREFAGLTMTVKTTATLVETQPMEDLQESPELGQPVLTVGEGSGQWQLALDRVPMMAPEATKGSVGEMEDALKVLGYLE